MSESNGATAVLEAPARTVETLIESVDAKPVVSAVEPAPELPKSAEELEREALLALGRLDTMIAGESADVQNMLKEYGATIKSVSDSPTFAQKYVAASKLGHEIMVAKRKEAPSAYKRGDAYKLLEVALIYSDVAASIEPKHIAPLYWIAVLDRSTYDEEGHVIYNHEPIPDDWFGGNISFKALLALRTCVVKTSGDTEIDCYVVAPGFEKKLPQILKRLRDGHASVRDTVAMVETHRKFVKESAERDRQSKMSKEAVEREEKRKQDAVFTSQQNKVKAAGRALAEMADEFKMPAESLRDILAMQGTIPPVAKVSIEAVALTMIPSDAKLLVQRLAELAQTDPVKRDTLAALEHAIADVAKQIKLRESA